MVTSCPQGIVTVEIPSSLSTSHRATASTTPAPPPTTVPYRAVRTDSAIISPLSWALPRPTARMSPISRVRSLTESTRVLTIPRTAMAMDSPSSPYRTARTWLTCWPTMSEISEASSTVYR